MKVSKKRNANLSYELYQIRQALYNLVWTNKLEKPCQMWEIYFLTFLQKNLP